MLLRRMVAGELEPAPIWADLKTLPVECLAGKVDVITGGFSCQPFSVAGKRNADTDQRHIFPYLTAAVRAIKPALCFFENVEGILSAKLVGTGWSDKAGTPVALHVIKELQRLGYKATFGMFSAAEVGLPHQRKRVFFVGVRHDIEAKQLLLDYADCDAKEHGRRPGELPSSPGKGSKEIWCGKWNPARNPSPIAGKGQPQFGYE